MCLSIFSLSFIFNLLSSDSEKSTIIIIIIIIIILSFHLTFISIYY